MKCYSREVLDDIALYGERHRFIPVLAAAQGYKVGEKVIAHRARRFGHSKYGFARTIKGFLDLITVWFQTRYGQRPQHFLGTVGLCLIVLAFMMALFSPYLLATALIGVLFIALGLLAELFVARTIQPDKCYSVKRQL